MITLSISKDITAGYTEMYVPFERLASITSKFNYSPSSYREGYRKQDNVINLGNTLMFDFDDGSISIDEMVGFLNDNGVTAFLSTTKSQGFLNDNGVTAFLSTTKSHNKDKHGKVCERYRVIVPLSGKINLPVDKFGDFYMFVARVLQFSEHLDKVCRDSARFFYSNPAQEVYLIKTGYVLDTEILIKNFKIYMENNQQEEKKEEIKKTAAQYENKKKDSDRLCKNEVSPDTLVEVKGGAAKPLSSFAYLQVGDSVPCRCLNPNHEDKHPSAFISRSKHEIGGLKVQCSGCGYTVYSPVK